MGLGWQLQATSTTFTTGTRSLPAGATVITAVTSDTCDGGAPCLLPSSSVTQPVTLPAAATAPAAVKVFNAALDTGEGRFAVSLDFATTVPQNAFAGTYTSTVTLSVVSGP